MDYSTESIRAGIVPRIIRAEEIYRRLVFLNGGETAIGS